MGKRIALDFRGVKRPAARSRYCVYQNSTLGKNYELSIEGVVCFDAFVATFFADVG
jgi:hypothetical protein